MSHLMTNQTVQPGCYVMWVDIQSGVIPAKLIWRECMWSVLYTETQWTLCLSGDNLTQWEVLCGDFDNWCWRLLNQRFISVYTTQVQTHNTVSLVYTSDWHHEMLTHTQIVGGRYPAFSSSLLLFSAQNKVTFQNVLSNDVYCSFSFKSHLRFPFSLLVM